MLALPPSLSLLHFHCRVSPFFHFGNIHNFTIFQNFCLLSAQFGLVIMDILYLKSHVKLMNQRVLPKFTNSAKNQILQALLF
jgi:hypothetical protein